MTRLGEVVKQFLAQMEWDDDLDDDETAGKCRLSTGLRIAGQPCRLYVDTSEQTDSIAVTVYPPFRVAESQYAEGCMLINAINYQTRHGRFEIDPSDGELRVVVSADIEGASPTGQFIAGMLNAAEWMIRNWLSELAAVSLCGRKAAEVLEEHERREAAAEADEDSFQVPETAAGSRLLN